MTYSYSNTPLYVREGEYIQFKFKAPSQWDYTETITVRIGDLLQFWLITTVPEDFTPDPYPFQKVEDAELDTLYTYADGSRTGESITLITGLTPTTQAAVGLTCNIFGGTDVYACRIDYDGDGTWDTDWIQPNTASGIVVENGAKIQVRGKSVSTSQSQTRVTLLVGTANETWTIVTRPVPINAPDPFPDFTDLNGLPASTMIYSEVLRVSGMNDPGLVGVDSGAEFGISSTNTTFTNGDGYEVLDGVTFSNTVRNIANGEYLQLRVLSASTPNTPKNISLSIGDVSDGSLWAVTTGATPSTSPNSFFFPDVVDALEDAYIPSDPKPDGGLLGLGVEVPVTLTSTTASDVKIKINNGSIGVFPATVNNGDVITLYAKSSPNFSETVETTIKVGSRTIPTWQVTTSSGPDYDAIFTPPSDRNNQVPNTYVSSSPVTVTGINRPITITATNGALISIDYDEAVVGPRVFDPTINKVFSLTLFSSNNLLTTVSTTVIVGTEADNVAAVTFTWNVTTYAVAPPPSQDRGVWYSKKTEKFDGYPIGTVIPVLKEAATSTYGDLGGDIGSRYAGFIECDGRSVSGAQYWALWEVIKNEYGGNVVKSTQNIVENGQIIGQDVVYTGNFNLPDYRNRRLCGTGFINSRVGNSSFLPVDSPGGGIFNVGSEGGYWYFDKVDVSGSLPLEQVEGTGNTGIDSQFFSLGTVRLAGLDTVTTEISFSISGTVTSQVGPLNDSPVQVPVHNHFYISAVIDGEDGDPLMPWQPEGRALFAFNADLFDPSNNLREYGASESDRFNKEIGGQDDVSPALFREWWERYIDDTFGTGFWDELRKYNPEYGDRDAFTSQLPTTSWDWDPEQGVTTIEFMTWWPSPASALDAALGAGLLNTISTEIGGQVDNPNREVTAVIDTNAAQFRVDSYVVPKGSTLNHSHFITTSPVSDPRTDYSGGHVSGAGIIGAPYGAGLGGAATNLQITFETGTNSPRDVFMDMTEGTFELSRSIKSPVPDVALAPQKQVPILNPFHKTKYIIKAY